MRKTWKPLLLLLLCLGLTVTLWGTGESYAWLTAQVNTSLGEGRMGRADIALDYDGSTGSFVLENTGEVSVYVRLGYTVTCRDADGEELNGAAVDARLTSLTLDGENVSAGEADFWTVIPLDPADETRYCPLRPGQTLRGEVALEGPEEAFDVEVVWHADTVTATAAAVEAAAGEGWLTYGQ